MARARLHGEDGAAAVEFAIVVAVLVIFIFGIIEFGMAFWQVQNLRAATREGARGAAVPGNSNQISNAIVGASAAFLPPGYLGFAVGGRLYRRRAGVNASVPAALAAAKSGAVTAATVVPETGAGQNAALNISGLQPPDGGIIDSSGCGLAPTGHVTTSYTTTQPLYFGEVIGLGNQRPVQATATAAWGPTGGATNPVPVVLNLATFQGNCEIPLPDAAIGQQCYLWYDNDRFVGSNFGFLDLSEWNVDPASTNCNAGGGSSQLESWIDGNYTGPALTLN